MKLQFIQGSFFLFALLSLIDDWCLLQKCVLEQGRQLVESQLWSTVLDYVQLAWTYVRATPLWDNPPHNAARRQCFKSLASQCMTALRRSDFTADIYDELYSK